MPALCSILNSAYYANNYAGIFDTGLNRVGLGLAGFERAFEHRLQIMSATYKGWEGEGRGDVWVSYHCQ